MATKTIKQTTIEYFREPSLTKAEILAMEAKIFPTKPKHSFWNVFTWMPKPMFLVLMLFMVGVPLFVIYTTQSYKTSKLSADASNFTANINQQAVNSIVYLEIFTDQVSDDPATQSWYDSTTGLNKTQQANTAAPIYAFQNYVTRDSAPVLSAGGITAESSGIDTDAKDITANTYELPELAAFMRAIGQNANSIEKVTYLGFDAYKIPVYETFGGDAYIYFIADQNIAYIVTPSFTRKIIYQFILPNTTNQNSIFDLNR